MHSGFRGDLKKGKSTSHPGNLHMIALFGKGMFADAIENLEIEIPQWHRGVAYGEKKPCEAEAERQE